MFGSKLGIEIVELTFNRGFEVAVDNMDELILLELRLEFWFLFGGRTDMIGVGANDTVLCG